MAQVTRIQAGQYSVSDGRQIIRDGSGWYVIDCEGNHDFGPLITLALAKEYVTTGNISLGQHNLGSKHGQHQSKKEFNAYLAAEAKNGNYVPVIIWFSVMFVIAIFMLVIQE